MKESKVVLLSIGEFARRSRLSAKALRLYGELGLLVPADVDPSSGYRYYEEGQLDRARLISVLRRIDVPLATIGVIVDGDSKVGAETLSRYWDDVENAHEERRVLTEYLLNRLNGKKNTMYDVTVREVPGRQILTIKRHVHSEEQVWAMGKEFIGIFRQRPVAPATSRDDAMFLIYYGQVNADSDGPVEFCRPISYEEAKGAAERYPELTLRTEPAHEEAVVYLGTQDPTPAQWELISASGQAWVEEHHGRHSDLGVRVTMFVVPPRTETSVPERDFAFPLASRSFERA